MKVYARALLFVTVLLVPGGAVVAQTTGRVMGQVVDDASQTVPGVTVSVRSPSLQGVHSATTDARGQFLIAFLPPGIYEVTIGLSGFRTIMIGGVRVELDHTATVRGRLKVAEVREAVDVTAPPPEIDVPNTATGLNATADLYTRIPLDRSFDAVARIAPGTQEDESGTAFYGSSGLENQYVIDGLNVTHTAYGGRGKELNLDFVEEVEVKTGGLPAEYGRTTGGILNVLTKSGGNDFHGSAFGFFAGGGLQSDNRTASRRPADTTTVDDTSSKWDYGASLGGRFVRDRVWFFGAFDRVADNSRTSVIRDLQSQGAPGVGSVVAGQSRDNRFAGKITWRPAVSSSLALSLFGDPSRITGPISGINGPPETYLGTAHGGGTDVALRYEGAFGGTFLLRALCGRHGADFGQGGPGTETSRFDDLTVSPPASAGGIGFYVDGAVTRDVCKLDLSKVVNGHELKVGGDIETVAALTHSFISGDDSVVKLAEGDRVYYLHSFIANDRAPGFDRNDPSTWRPAHPFVASPRTRNVSAYAQDAWRIHKGFTLNLGLRFERQELEDRDGNTPLAVDNLAPRVGAAWALKRDGRSKLYAAFSRYFESIPQYIQFAAFGGANTVFIPNFDPMPGSLAPDPSTPEAPSIFGGTSTAVDSGIRGQYVDEWLFGFERELRGDFVFGFKAARRSLGRVIEDLTAGGNPYFVGNPGEGGATTLAFFDGSSAPSPKPRRDNTSFEFSARKRLSRGWQVLASYVWTRLRGNYEGLYQRSLNYWAPNSSSAFDFADFLVNADGPLTSESVHQAKLDGSYEFRGKAAGLNVGLSTHWFSGLPENAYGLSANYLSNQYYLVPRGTVGRNPADFEIDAHLDYPLPLGRTARLQLQADVFNLLDRQAIVRYDDRYNLIPDGPCSGVPEELCTQDGGLRARPGTVEPVASLPGDPRRTATNPDYLRSAIAFTGQRSLRLGVRLTF